MRTICCNHAVVIGLTLAMCISSIWSEIAYQFLKFVLKKGKEN